MFVAYVNIINCVKKPPYCRVCIITVLCISQVDLSYAFFLTAKSTQFNDLSAAF